MNGLENLKAVRARFHLFPKQMETGKGSEIVEDSKDDLDTRKMLKHRTSQVRRIPQYRNSQYPPC